MKATITLELKTREAYHLFTRKINGDRLFIDTILHKLNKITGACRKKDAKVIEQYQYIKRKFLELKNYFKIEDKKLISILQEEECLKGKIITTRSQFHPILEVENSLTMELIQVLEHFDSLMATVRLLFLAGSFKSSSAYYTSISKYQKILNQVLSQTVFLSMGYETPSKS
jgi:hypothetical protein